MSVGPGQRWLRYGSLIPLDGARALVLGMDRSPLALASGVQVRHVLRTGFIGGGFDL